MKKHLSLSVFVILAFLLTACPPPAVEPAAPEAVATPVTTPPPPPEVVGPIEPVSFDVELTGDQQVPPVDTLAFGTATVTVEGNMLTVTGSFRGLESNLMEIAGTPAHIHEAPAGETGPIVLPLQVTPDANMRGGSFNLEELLTQELMSALTANSLYINVHTEQNPGGEIRGQIVPPADLFPAVE